MWLVVGQGYEEAAGSGACLHVVVGQDFRNHLAIHSVTIMCHLLPGSVRGTEMPCGQKAPALVGRDRYGASCEYGVVRAVMEVNTGSCRSTYQGPLALR